MRIEWTDRAVRSKQNVADYIRDRFGFKHKRKFVQEVDRTARMLMKHPNMGPVEPLLADLRGSAAAFFPPHQQSCDGA